MATTTKTSDATDACETTLVNAAAVAEARELTPEPEVVMGLAEIFRLLSDPTRLHIVTWLRHHELCVCDLASLLDITRSAVSHQLRLLRAQRIVKYRRQGKMAYYSLDDEHVNALLDVALSHVEEG